jgi:hypothetical protein
VTEGEIIERMTEADRSWNTATISIAMVEMMQQDKTLTFADFEAALREIGSSTFLIARPIRMLPNGMRAANLNNEPTTHFLWVCLHGEEERDQELANIDTTSYGNEEALKACGLLMLDSPHDPVH